MLDLAQIPLTWQERDQGNYPLIFAGGQLPHLTPNLTQISSILSH
jgi:hypothetical protein